MIEYVILNKETGQRFSVFFESPYARDKWLKKHKMKYTKKLEVVAKWNE